MSCRTAGWVCRNVLSASSAHASSTASLSRRPHSEHGGIKRVSASFRELTASGYEDKWASPACGAVCRDSVTNRTASPSCVRFPQSRMDLARSPPCGRAQREPHMDRRAGARDRTGRIGRSLVLIWESSRNEVDGLAQDRRRVEIPDGHKVEYLSASDS